jgi:hypothetical protein
MTTLSVNLTGTPVQVQMPAAVAAAGAATSAITAQAAKVGAETAAGNAAATLARASQPFVTPPAGGSALLRLLDPQLWTESIDGKKINWPANLSVREIAADSNNRFRFRLGGGDTVGADGNYPQIGAESINAAAAGATSPGALNIGYSGLTPGTILYLYASDDSLGVPQNTIIGTYRVSFDGTTFGTYFPFAVFTAAAGLLVRTAVLPGESFVQNVTDIAKDVVRLQAEGRWYEPTLQSTYIPQIIDDISVEFAVPEKGRYVLNVRTDRTPVNYRITLRLFDTVRQVVVAYRSRIESAPFNPGVMYLSGASNGGILTAADGGDPLEWTGAHATVWFSDDFLDKVDWTFGASTFTTAANAIRVNRILTTEQVGEMIRTGRGIRNHIITVDASGDGDFETFKEAHDSLLDPGLAADPDDIQRAWWPLSQICTPSNQYEIRGKRGHTETKLPVVPDGVGFARGLLCWMGLTYRLPGGSTFTAQDADDLTTYFFDYNLGGRIIAESDTVIVAVDTNESSAVHQDQGGAITKPSVANEDDPSAGQLFFKIFGVMEGGLYRSPIQAYNAGVADGEDITFKGPVFETTGSGPNFSSHNSPANAFPGRYTFEDVSLIGGTKTINLTNLPIPANPVVARHEIIVRNSDVTNVTASLDANGDCPFVRIGKQPGVTYSAALEP